MISFFSNSEDCLISGLTSSGFCFFFIICFSSFFSFGSGIRSGFSLALAEGGACSETSLSCFFFFSSIIFLAFGANGILVSSVICPGGQGDVSIVGDLLIMSVQDTRGRLDCGLQGAGSEPTPDRFRGIRIFDISNLEIGNKLYVTDVADEKYTFLHPDNTVVCQVRNSRVSLKTEEEEVEGEEGAEGETAPAAEGANTPAEGGGDA